MGRNLSGSGYDRCDDRPTDTSVVHCQHERQFVPDERNKGMAQKATVGLIPVTELEKQVPPL